ncbi:S8 family serine peptidase [Rhodocytophaga rosea]|uniref:S8 family serine peptidase n=1 Tax=Rhodocytophaga rosea TaxID=2704465 RepID=A0A6C0GRN2_9BACT|nr:S8 family peptidase [Rhodocytophaga rosea]QHT70202.1 S8 family serine peptidase [Rhodocytophaga rosea]
MKLKFIIILGVSIIPYNFLFANIYSESKHTNIHYQSDTPSDTTKKAPANWFNLDRSEDKIQGVSTEKAYEEILKNKPSKTVIVGVIDSGVDVEHEDLQGHVWMNPDEKAGNGVDDDRNGYVDDIHGWNFIGGKDGRNVEYDTYELTREYARLKPKYSDASKKIRKKDKANYEYYLKIQSIYESKVTELKEQYDEFKKIKEAYTAVSSILKNHLKKDTITVDDLQTISAQDKMLQDARNFMQYALENDIESYLKEGGDYFTEALEYGYNLEFDPRNIVGDNYNDINEKYYGNNDVTGPDARHGTHVAGIIAANRNNTLGIKGVADNVQIMAIRAVPNGDERDKDIANAIYYAVDNGAQVINMSFGKSYSPHKEAVDAAIQYALSKGVLLIHAAGNDAKNTDIESNFPNKKFSNKNVEASNWIEVGASSWGGPTNFVGTFTNYGKKSVDVFAPGVDVYSTTPKQGYENLSGTSMAAPVTAGVAALLMSYYPNLSADQIRNIIIKSTVKFEDLSVNKPGSSKQGKPENVKFNDLSVTGGIVNAYEAIKMAEAITNEK